MCLSWLPLVKVVKKTSQFLPNMLKVVPIGKVVSMGRKMEMVKRSFSSFFDKSDTKKFAQEALVSDTKSTKQEKNRGWFKVCLMLFLVFSTGPKGVRSEDIGNLLVPGSTAMNSLLANKNVRGPELSERRQAAAMYNNISYNDFPHGNYRPDTPGREKANPSERPCNRDEYCRQGNNGKKN